MAQLAQPNSLDLTALVNLFTNKSGSTSTSSTTSSNISKEGMDALVKQILESDAGVASILSGPKRAGIYNSSATQQLLGDFVARTAGELAAKKAGTTTSGTTSQNLDPALNFGKVAGGVALTSLLGPTVSRGLESAGITGGLGGVGKSLADLIFGQPVDLGYNRNTGDAATTVRAIDNATMAEDVSASINPVEQDYSWLFNDTGDIWGD